MTRRVLTAVGLAGLLLTGCSDDPAPSGDGSDPVVDVGGDGQPSKPAETGTGVRVDAQVTITRSKATEAFTSYVQAYAASVNAGRPTPELRALTTSTLYDRQVVQVDAAREQGYAVSDRPRVAVVSEREGAARTVLGVCIWLPSLEYVDAATGEWADGVPPRAWSPAVAQLAKRHKTLLVDRLFTSPKVATNCQGLS